ncbi:MULTISPECIES: Nif11-like leader peptide family RiPP precursor [unclassified Synechococcus]|uniref:Nif11-like leader peptide family RiPP precursor n=1 Tax=unclassified Synechococcus TaxID=2626047 RepID=UPI0008FF586B|nr:MULTISPECIES: Nif11-like leader peptide family RiPP precursor [unclassified Synechococcus]MCT4365972.1 Nif11-like leader peptide family RiPP precursor [Candidatus Regnicoccus frigidus MAG-AL1]APD48818.1 bacteriocin [Synechococcus sp. SynAce01]MCT0201700.1 Nif11-like leader peptide family RiPP precursor [Synechococcus sp. CS-603]MCT0245158.1 Nif11-like leader peptide family RiPP precursor [Synechococcus sp. CS-601]TWB87177.1 putative ribosomally synthesized peptide with nif11-like leader [Sy
MSLQQLDAFLLQASLQPQLQARLNEPLELADFLMLARGEGYAVEETDLLEAREREESQRSASELQQRAGDDARRLRNFIPG